MRTKQTKSRFRGTIPKKQRQKRQKANSTGTAHGPNGATAFTDDELRQWNEQHQRRYAPIDQPMPLPMADAAYYGKAGQIVDIITKAGTEACRESLLVQFLVAFGNIIGRKPFRHQAATHHLNEFAVLVGESGIGAKGTSWNALSDLLQLINQSWFFDRVQDGFQSGESVIDKVRDSSVRFSRAGKPTTIPGVTDKRLLIMEEEFARILIVGNREGNTLSVVLRNSWDGKTVLWTSSKNDPQKATQAHVSLIGHITPEELRRNLSEIDATNGFANRINWVAVKGVGDVPFPPRIDWKKSHPDLIRDLGEIVTNFQTRSKTELKWSRQAEPLWEAYHRELKKRRFGGLIGPILKRSIAHTLRYAMLYAVLDNSSLIKPEHLDAAVAVVQYGERSAAWAFTEKTGDKNADKIFWALQREPDRKMNRNKIRVDVFNNRVASTDLDKAFSLLKAMELVDISLERVPGSDKPAEFCKLK
jgi:Protein of unknown function (DUF3987)